MQREKLRRKKERAVEVQLGDEKGAGKRGSESRSGYAADEDAMDIDQEGGGGRVTRGSKRGHGGQERFGFGGGAGRRLG